jgi:DNA mismatch repair ATPase MutS
VQREDVKMRNIGLEKSINRIDSDIAALGVASKYLSNKEEINAVKVDLNKERQSLVNELYSEDSKAYEECCASITELVEKKLGKEEQLELLSLIKEKYGRQAPNVSKKSNGLNAWLNELDLEYDWIENEEDDWATLVIHGFGIHK